VIFGSVSVSLILGSIDKLLGCVTVGSIDGSFIGSFVSLIVGSVGSLTRVTMDSVNTCVKVSCIDDSVDGSLVCMTFVSVDGLTCVVVGSIGGVEDSVACVIVVVDSIESSVACVIRASVDGSFNWMISDDVSLTLIAGSVRSSLVCMRVGSTNASTFVIVEFCHWFS